MLNDLLERLQSVPEQVSWINWKKDDTGKRYAQYNVKGSMKSLIEYFLTILDKFLKHSFVKRCQAASFEQDWKEVEDCIKGILALLQLDFAEHYKWMKSNRNIGTKAL